MMESTFSSITRISDTRVEVEEGKARGLTFLICLVGSLEEKTNIGEVEQRRDLT